MICEIICKQNAMASNMRYCYSKNGGTSATTNYNSLGLQNYVLTSKKGLRNMFNDKLWIYP